MAASSTAPSLTFAIPFYRGVPYLVRTLDSVRAQRDPAWQAIVCDDGTEPGVAERVRGLGDDRIRYLHNGRNLGLGGNFNRCLDVAETELVTVLHADDELMPTYAGTMRAAAQLYPDAAAFFCRATIIGPDGRPVFSLPDFAKRWIDPSRKRVSVLAGEPAVRALLKGNFIMAPTLCFQKRILGTRRFPERFQFVLDQELTTGLLLDGETLVGLPDCCYRYRRHDDNATSHLTRSQLRFREESDYYDRMQVVARGRGWDACALLAKQKRIIKLNLAYRTLRSAARLDLAQARRGLALLREL